MASGVRGQAWVSESRVHPTPPHRTLTGHGRARSDVCRRPAPGHRQGVTRIRLAARDPALAPQRCASDAALSCCGLVLRASGRTDLSVSRKHLLCRRVFQATICLVDSDAVLEIRDRLDRFLILGLSTRRVAPSKLFMITRMLMRRASADAERGPFRPSRPGRGMETSAARAGCGSTPRRRETPPFLAFLGRNGRPGLFWAEIVAPGDACAPNGRAGGGGGGEGGSLFVRLAKGGRA